MQMNDAKWWVALAVLAAGATGCSDGAAPPDTSSSGPDPTSAVTVSDGPRPMSPKRLDKLTHFLDRVELLEEVGPEFELRHVEYTSATDAVASFVDVRTTEDLGTVIATTDDNWAHAARLRISWELADLVDYVPLGRGAVAIKAKDQFPTRSYPPIVLYPDGRMEPLRAAGPRPLDEGSDLLGIEVYNLFSRPAVDPYDNIRTDANGQGLWAVDVDAAELFPLAGSPLGDVHQHLPGRDGIVMSVQGYRHGTGDGVWRYETTADAGRSWQRSDIDLPLGRKYLWRYADVTSHVVGPGRLQAIAMSDAPEDMPLSLRELWLTDDEQQFRRLVLPWDRLRFGGMAFAPDGSLLLAEVQGSDRYCGAPAAFTCDRPGRIWRLEPGSAEPRLLAEAPRLFGPFWAVGIQPSGGSIVARTGMRTIALSVDGYRWTEVTPGQRDVSR